MPEKNTQAVNMPSVAIIGSGNVASHLSIALGGKVRLLQVNPHTLDGLTGHVDFAIISVKDSAIKEVAAKLTGKCSILAHTSGSVPMSVLEGCAPDYGVFYPLQTFTKGVSLNYSEIPFFIEGNYPATVDSLSRLARIISDNVTVADSEARKTLHLASVFTCNFSNCLVGIADGLLKESGMDYHVLLPLLRQTIAKLDRLSPQEAQTGPAARRDMPVINAHIQMLKEKGLQNLAEIYQDLSAEIIKAGSIN